MTVGVITMRMSPADAAGWRLMRAVISALLLAATAAAAWLFLAPVSIGGSASYVVTDGTSMLPHFRADGLVITRAEPAYYVGEVVAYHNGDLHTVVMHRIVARDGDRYVFKGDNNDFRDSFHPTKSELVGKEWIYVPSAGRYFQYLRQPVVFGLIFAFIGVLAVGYPAESVRRHRRHHAK